MNTVIFQKGTMNIAEAHKIKGNENYWTEYWKYPQWMAYQVTSFGISLLMWCIKEIHFVHCLKELISSVQWDVLFPFPEIYHSIIFLFLLSPIKWSMIISTSLPTKKKKSVSVCVCKNPSVNFETNFNIFQ